MKQFSYLITNPLGIHARPAALLAQACVEFKSVTTFECNGNKAAGNNVLQIMALHAAKGQTLEITVEGTDEEACATKIMDVLQNIAPKDKAVPVLKVAFFGTKDYDRIFFSELAREKGEGTYNTEIKYFNSRLTIESARLAQGFDAVCIFVNDEAPREVIEVLHDCGAMAIIQAANRRIHKSYQKVKDNNFALNGLLGVDLHNKVAGIVGTGRIGQIFAQICKGFGMTVIGWDAFPNQKLVDEGLLTYVSKEELFQKADLISLHAPLIMGEKGTYHIIDEKAIALMKDTVMLVNSARGGLIDTEALIAAMKKGKFHAVALDVYEGEDKNVYTDRSDEPLETAITGRLTMFPQLILTSHQAFFTREALQAIAAVTMENARNFNEKLPYGMAEVK